MTIDDGNFRIPSSVTHAEFLEAIKPLFELLQVTPLEVFGDGIHIDATHVSFMVVRPAEDDSKDMVGVLTGDRPQEFSELGWPVRVEIKS